MEIQLNFFNYTIEVELEYFSNNLGEYFSKTLKYLLIDEFKDSKYEDWLISIELCGGDEKHNLKYFYSGKSNKYKIIYLYFFINESINGLSTVEKERIIFQNLLLNVNDIFTLLKLNKKIELNTLKELSDYFLIQLENNFFRINYSKKSKRELNLTINNTKKLISEFQKIDLQQKN